LAKYYTCERLSPELLKPWDNSVLVVDVVVDVVVALTILDRPVFSRATIKSLETAMSQGEPAQEHTFYHDREPEKV